MASNFTVINNAYIPLKELVLITLRQAILKGEIQPGERLMEIQLAEKLGVSRTPVREAIHRLSDEGLVSISPRRGAVVAGISEKLLIDVLEVRMTLEKMAGELAFKNITPAQTEKLKEAQLAFEEAARNNDPVGISDADELFHFTICEAAGNLKLKEILLNLRESMYRYRMEHAKSRQAVQRAIASHIKIIEAFEKHDSRSGLEAVEEHINDQKNLILAKIHADARDAGKTKS